MAEGAAQWAQIKALLDACAEMEPEARVAWLESACPDPALRRRVASYLVYEDEVETFDAPTPGVILPVLDAIDEDESGRRIGPYRLDSLLGRGGMGSVYRAYREAEFEQQVALKLVRAGLETPENLARFHTERQILARLEHLNIARLLDGGTYDGRPYFGMELVEGTPIDQYCDQHRLDVKERLALILKVSDGLAFAHRNLVLHLDLKPSNILVTEDGTPKLLDFGIGELLARAQDTVETRARRMTVRYASPEQLRGVPLATASDIYSLGVVAYELLTARVPCGAYAQDESALAMAICSADPEPASAVVLRRETVGLGASHAELDPRTVARTREQSPALLHRRLRGDLDAALLRALAKDPAERYISVDQFAADLRRHLDGFPLEARGDHLSYRAAKFVRRNRWSVGVVSLVVTLILGFTAALSHQLHDAERQRLRATRVSDFMVGLFRAAEPDRAGEQPSVRELVDLGRQRLDAELEDEPEVRAQLLSTLGRVYYRLGFLGEADETQQAALTILDRALTRDHPDIARTLGELGVVSYTRGRYHQAEDYTRRSIAMRHRLGAEEDVLKPLNTLASILMLRGQLDEAEATYADVLARRRARFGDRHPNVARSLRNLATAHYVAGRFDAAEPLLREALDIRLEHHDRKSTPVRHRARWSGPRRARAGRSRGSRARLPRSARHPPQPARREHATRRHPARRPGPPDVRSRRARHRCNSVSQGLRADLPRSSRGGLGTRRPRKHLRRLPRRPEPARVCRAVPTRRLPRAARRARPHRAADPPGPCASRPVLGIESVSRCTGLDARRYLESQCLTVAQSGGKRLLARARLTRAAIYPSSVPLEESRRTMKLRERSRDATETWRNLCRHPLAFEPNVVCSVPQRST